MSTWEEGLAFKHAPVLLQKVNLKYARADFITKVNFSGPWGTIHDNWKAVWREEGGLFKHRLRAHGYYSVVQTHTHSYILYAFYHPQDWAAVWGHPRRSSPSKLDQHLHDMEGALAVVPTRPRSKNERVEAVITISHYHFYSFAGWENSQGKAVGSGFRILGWAEDVDGPMQVTKQFSQHPGEPSYRFKLYSASGSHAIKGGKKEWGDSDRIIRYRPSRTTRGEPKLSGFKKNGEDAYFQEIPYKLLSMFGRDGIWRKRDDPKVFQANDKGQEAFVIKKRNSFVAGSANPPWGWDDKDDRNKAGDLAWDPAHLVANYFGGLREFSREYVHNPYLGVMKTP